MADVREYVSVYFNTVRSLSTPGYKILMDYDNILNKVSGNSCPLQYTVVCSVLHKTAAGVCHAVVDGLTRYIDWLHTITYDNGREFADHAGMARLP